MENTHDFNPPFILTVKHQIAGKIRDYPKSQPAQTGLALPKFRLCHKQSCRCLKGSNNTLGRLGIV